MALLHKYKLDGGLFGNTDSYLCWEFICAALSTEHLPHPSMCPRKVCSLQQGSEHSLQGFFPPCSWTEWTLKINILIKAYKLFFWSTLTLRSEQASPEKIKIAPQANLLKFIYFFNLSHNSIFKFNLVLLNQLQNGNIWSNKHTSFQYLLFRVRSS